MLPAWLPVILATAHQSAVHIPTNNATVGVRRKETSNFASCEVHQVRTASGSIINDWVMFGERPHVNVLVRTRSDGKFIVFRQLKYALQGESLAPVGGFVDDGEVALDAAKRELLEELGLRSHRWVALGTFTTSANRFGGLIHAFFADDCVPSHQRAQGDAESQHVVRLSRSGLLSALAEARFQEVKWTATIALALLRLGL
mmetsp:Transcript_63597/g.105754  ORF Transcript_63597/g.105754 Transcript_63597/m.105754 type:complete len:201 (-) Transcript_63597:89-691(-)|eukprot:CAMPEP_0119310164 /NCGR_PEP_ID=MMETSP1333-20130426/17877_1 /TAXON_ID=418940 /ORGANISM="Scyphosphaera apsteinii, Strain RCC1455" /LENGTH=200 /DNA_ID=CAMNT_0007314293 /DNA_START=216 /DNA_END=818 /DNA_ORIENTATION=-